MSNDEDYTYERVNPVKLEIYAPDYVVPDIFDSENSGQWSGYVSALREYAQKVENMRMGVALSDNRPEREEKMHATLTTGGITSDDGFKVISQFEDTQKEYDYYIAGPMTGYEDHNSPAFHEAEDHLEEFYSAACFNPAKNFGGDTGLSWETYLRSDIQAIAKSRNIYLLQGWRQSRGACFEYLVAKTLGLGIEKQGNHFLSGKMPILNENSRIALCGYSRVGKDEVGKWFIERGYNRRAIGDLIKSQVDPVVQAHLGYSAFTEDDEKKENIREFLVHWGYANYDNILDEYFDSLSGRVVNTRLYRFKEAKRWVEESGKILLVERPGFDEREPKAKEELDRIKKAGLISETIVNDGSISDLHDKLDRMFPEIGTKKAEE